MNEQQKKLLNYALTLLAKRRFTIREMVRKLEARNRKSAQPCQDSELQLVLEKLVKSNFLNDQDYAYFFVESRTNGNIYKPIGPHKIRAKLQQKGIDIEHIDQALQQADFNEQQMALDLLERKIKSLDQTVLKQQKVQARLLRYLQNNGFSMNICYKTLQSKIASFHSHD
ncbi:regulatory protein RecX [Candidatus Peregrinibacteria bacterium]|nr:regulatory protein RecX [Candidatus Peregrinibacteria bacterium]